MRLLSPVCNRQLVGIAMPFFLGCIFATALITAHAAPSSGTLLMISHPLAKLPASDRANLDAGRKHAWEAGMFPTCSSRWEPTRFGDSKAPFVSFRAGMALAPNLGFAGGIDFTIPSLSISPQLITRLDGDVLAAFNAHSFGGYPGTTFAFTVDQIYSPHWGGRYAPYAGLGIGPYWQENLFISGKAFVGVQFGPTVSSELDIHFPGHGAAIIALEMRVSAL